MENNINDIDKLFKDSLGDHQSPYVNGAWENMEAMLNAGDSGFMLKNNIKRYILASVAGTIILAGSVVAYISGYDAGHTTAQNNTSVIEMPVATAPQTQSNSEANTPNTDITTDNSADANATTNNTGAANTPSSIIKKGATTTPATNNGGSTTNNDATPTAIEQNAPTTVVLATEENQSETASPSEAITSTTNDNTEVIEKSTLSSLLLNGKLPLFSTSNGAQNFDESLHAQHYFVDSVLTNEKRLDQIKSFYSWQIGIQAGGNFNRVISNTSSNTQLGSGFMAGLYVGKNLNRRWGLSAEFNYLRSNNNNISRNVTQTTYFFERTTTNYFLVTKSLDYLQVPVSISYDLTKANKHRVSFGIVGMYMINARTEVAEQKQNHVEKYTTTTTKKGVYEDLNTFNYGLHLGYEYNLPGTYSLGVRYNQMFNNVTKSSYFGDGKSQLPAHLQLFVKLNLTK